MAKKKTHKEFMEEIKEKNPGIEILGTYQKDNVKILCLCKVCGYKWEGIPSNLLRGSGCKECANRKMAKKRSKTTEQFKKELYKINPNLEVVGKYINNKTNIKVKCKLHNYIWEPKPNNLLNGKGCPICGKERGIEKQTKSHTKFLEEVKEINPNIKVIGKYKGNKKPIKCKCTIDGTVFYPHPSNLLKGQGCPTCGIRSRADKRRMTQGEFEEILEEVNPNIKVLGEYITQKDKILVACKKDGYTWEAKALHLLNGHGCPVCNESKGEETIRKYLRKNHIKYRGQYKIKECKNKKPLPFDFALFNKDKLVALIEYQGIHHYEPIELFGGKERFEYQQKNDNIKRNYCKINNIPLIEIPYTVENIEEYLDRQLLQLNKPIQLALTN